MPRNGSGTYTRGYSWVADRDAAIPITASRMDDDTDDIADEITNSVAADGQTTMTGNLKMGNNKVTSLADAVALTDGANLKQVQNGTAQYAVDTGSANAYAIAPAPTVTAYVAGQIFVFKATNTNTTASTLAVSGLTTKAIQKLGAALVAGDITLNDLVAVRYDGTQFQMLSPARTPVLTNSSIGTNAIADNAVTLAKLATLANLAVIGNTSGSTTTPSAVEILDEDNMTSDSATKLATQQSIKAYVDGKYAVLRSLSSSIAAANGTSSIPNDNTSPLISEGTEIWSYIITPQTNTNKIRINGAFALQGNASTTTTVAVFAGSTCIKTYIVDTQRCTQSINIEHSPASASAQTYSIRVGIGSGTWYVNSDISGPFFNGTMAGSSMTVEEIKA